jgi:hypothetical protein
MDNSALDVFIYNLGVVTFTIIVAGMAILLPITLYMDIKELIKTIKEKYE